MQIVKRLFPLSPQPKDLLAEIQEYISCFDSTWAADLCPEKAETIQLIEQFAKETFQIQLPESYLSYLAKMGRNDGNLIMKSFDCDECTTFEPAFIMNDVKKQTNGYGQGFLKNHIYPFCYALLSEVGYGFSATSTNPEQIAVIHWAKLFHAPDTFSKLLFYFAFHYVYFTCLSGSRLADVSTELPAGDPNEVYSTHIWIRPSKKGPEPQSQYHEIISQLEQEFSITECWFSTGKQQYLSDTDNQPTTEPYDLSRYIGQSVSENCGIAVKQSGSSSWVNVIGYGTESAHKILAHLQVHFPQCTITIQTGRVAFNKDDWRNKIRENGVRVKKISVDPVSHSIITKLRTLTVTVQLWRGGEKKLIFHDYRAMKEKFSTDAFIGDVLIKEQSPFLSELQHDMDYVPESVKNFVFIHHSDDYAILEILAESVDIE